MRAVGLELSCFNRTLAQIPVLTPLIKLLTAPTPIPKHWEPNRCKDPSPVSKTILPNLHWTHELCDGRKLCSPGPCIRDLRPCGSDRALRKSSMLAVSLYPIYQRQARKTDQTQNPYTFASTIGYSQMGGSSAHQALTNPAQGKWGLQLAALTGMPTKMGVLRTDPQVF